MAFPVVAASAETTQTTTVTRHPQTMPSGIVAGNLLVSVWAMDANATPTVPGDWVVLNNTRDTNSQLRLVVSYKWAAGGDTLTITTSATRGSCGFVLRITGAHASRPPEIVAATA